MESLSAAYLPFTHSVASRKYHNLESLWPRSSSSHFSNTRTFFLISRRRHASSQRTSLLAFSRGGLDDAVFSKYDFNERYHYSDSITPGNSADTRDSRQDSLGRTRGTRPESRRFEGRRRTPMTKKFEYERFKEMFTDKNSEMTEQSANVSRIPSLDAGRSRIAHLSESQPSRLHNKFAVFERATESKVVRLSTKVDSREDDHAQSGTVPRKVPRLKSSYSAQGKSSPKNTGRFSSHAGGQKGTHNVSSESSSSNFSSKLQIILNNFDKRDRATASEPSDNPACSLGLQAGNSPTFRQREDFWNPPVQTTQDTRKASFDSEETSSTSFKFSIEDANEKSPETLAQMDDDAEAPSPFNLFSNAPPVPSATSKCSSDPKFLTPTGIRSMVASRQHTPISQRRLFKSVGSRSSPSRASIPGKFSKYSERSDLNHKQRIGSHTSTAESRPSLREEQAQLSSKSKEDLNAQFSQDVDANTRAQPRNVDSFNSHSLSSQISTVSSQDASMQEVPLESQAKGPQGRPDSSSQMNVQVGDSAPSEVEANLISAPLQQVRPSSDAEDAVDSGAFDEANAMSSSHRLIGSFSEENNSSRMVTDQTSNANVRSFGGDLHATPGQSAMSSPAVLSVRSNPDSSSITDLDVETEPLQKVSPNSETSQISAMNQSCPNLHFEFQYSYSETPNAPILRYREPQHSPFGPITMDRPWTGRPPLKPSKKKPRVFDSFKPPPHGKKGIKYVQDPGPFPEGQQPKAALTREEILGEPLTKEEVAHLVEKGKNEKRQVNLGRDGLTHNMLDLIHSQWKRRRVCRIKCKGVPTVDMNNVYFHIEDKTGGRIIHRTGGVLFLYRGRNYNYKDRPKIPLMLWKPASPVYPKLIPQAPRGLTKEQAEKLRLLGWKTASLCRLGKNGVYLNLVKDVKNAFKVDDLVRIDCRGLNPSDYKKIGAKLRDLVPCVLLSFEKEHILLWKGRECSADSVDVSLKGADTTSIDNLELETLNQSSFSDIEPLDYSVSESEMKISSLEPFNSVDGTDSSYCSKQYISGSACLDDTQLAPGTSYFTAENRSVIVDVNGPKVLSPVKQGSFENPKEEGKGHLQKEISSQKSFLDNLCLNEVDIVSEEALSSEYSLQPKEVSGDSIAELAVVEVHQGNLLTDCNVEQEYNQINIDFVEVAALWEQALESGMANAIDGDLDSDSVFHIVDKVANTAPPGPTYTVALLKELRLNNEKRISAGESSISIGKMHTRNRQKKKEVKQATEIPLLEAPSMGGLPVDELAKLLAPQ